MTAKKGKTYKMYGRLLDEIKAAGLTQKEIAAFLGVDPSYLSCMIYGVHGNGCRCAISLERAIAIQERYFPELTVNELFETRAYTL
jgi:transcriptional regulator with XRE-family HTH domain